MKKVLSIAVLIMLMAGMVWAENVKEAEQTKFADDSFLAAKGPAPSGGILLGGGPDAFGYVWKDSRDAGGPVFNWRDISVDGTEIVPPWPHGTAPGVDDGWTDPIPMGITFNYYGIDYTDIVIGTNGWASFVAQTASYLSNAAIPTAANPNCILAPLWDDLDGGTVGHVYYYNDAAQNQFIVSWVNWPYYPDPTDPKDFQIILDSDDSTIVFQYGAGTFSQTDITVGIENETGTIGLQVAYNVAYPINNLATKFSRPPLLAHNVGVNAILTPGATTYVDSLYTVTCNVRNFGLNTETNIPVRYQIFDSTGAVVYNNLFTIPSLASETDYVVSFPDWTPAEPNTHTLKAFTSLGGDLDRTNDTTYATTFTRTHRGNGGPADYWYFADNITGGGPAFNWVDITGVGEMVSFSSQDDGNSGLADMGMSFNFFGTSYTRLAISTNGWMSFIDSTSTGLTNTTIPSTSTPNAIIALLWDDLHIGTGAIYRYYDAGTNRYIVQYNNVEFYSSGGPDCIDMEMILDGTANTITMQYNNFCDSSQADITIGIENATGTVGLAYNNSGEYLQRPYNGVAITWTYNPPANDVGATAILAPPSTGVVGYSQAVSTRIHNYGENTQATVPVRYMILDSTGAIIYNQATTYSNLAPLADADITFPNWTPATAGTFRLKGLTSLAGDFNVLNDTVRGTIVVSNPNTDVGASAIFSPGAGVVVGAAIPVSARINNYGNITQATVPARFQIFDGVGGVVYDQTASLTNLLPGTNAVLNFPNWTPATEDVFALKVFTTLGGDSNALNDTTNGSTTSYLHRSSDGPVENWSYIDNLGGGPAFSWVDITSVGTIIPFATRDDSNSGLLDMGMTFNFFGTTYSQIAVSTNGWMSFTDGSSTALTNAVMPTTGLPNDLVALLWDDLHLGAAGEVYYYFDSANNRFIVQYNNTEFYPSGGPDCIDMEAIFDGNTNSIIFQYNTFCTGSQTDITIGIENSDGTIALAYDNNEEFGQTPSAGLRVTYTYVPLDHDVSTTTLVEPAEIIYSGQVFNIIATVVNRGANTETFQVRATDDHGYTNTQTVTALAPFASTNVTFPNWTISQNCVSYGLTITTLLGTDMLPENDAITRTMLPVPNHTAAILYDDGTGTNAWRYTVLENIIANKFDISYQGAPIEAIGFRFTNNNLFPTWPDGNRDPVNAYIFIDNDLDGLPETQVFTEVIQVASEGWTIWPIGCANNILMSCQSFWAGWSQYDLATPEGIALDAATDYPNNKWAYTSSGWALNNTYAGDNMIRVFYNDAPGTNAQIGVGSYHLNGYAPAGGNAQASTTIDNEGNGCDLVYTVRVLQSLVRTSSNVNQAQPIITPGADISQTASMFGLPVYDGKDIMPSEFAINSNRKGTFLEDENPPVIQSSGGPDLYGYIWKDSAEPDGPVFGWVDISTTGTPVPWDGCSATFGCEDDGYTFAIPMGMNFIYYGNTFSDIYVSSNGWISFDAPTTWYAGNTTMPGAAVPNNLIAVLWDDLAGNNDSLNIGVCRTYYDAAQNQFIVSWDGWGFYNGTEICSIQVILDGDDNSIVMQYSGIFEQNDLTIGIENFDGTDGLQVAYNADYAVDGLAVKYIAPTFWLTTDLVNGILAPTDPPLTFHANMDATELPNGVYDGAIVISSNDVSEPVSTVLVTFTVSGGGGGCQYVVGDINGNGSLNGIDVTYGVSYFKGGNLPPYSCECTPGNTWFVAGDVNGSCVFNGIDITYLVSYFKGGAAPRGCPSCLPTMAAPLVPSTPALAPSKVGNIDLQQ